jgi:murein DD-endopeptidase MepM/ murein hydrolase activator NlpD
MGMGWPRSFACVLAALALIAVAAPTAPAASAKGKKHHRVFKFGTRTLAPGAKGKDVRFLQRALTSLGVPTSIDGAYGKGTKRSVKTFESERGWPVDGVVTKKDAKRIVKLLTKGTSSGGYFVRGATAPTLLLQARDSGTATVKVLDGADAEVVKGTATFSSPGTGTFSWDGTLDGVSAASDGTYHLKLTDPGTAKATVTGGQTDPFDMHLHAFPVPGAHSFGGTDARFGAPRSGHIHQGQDVPAACGEPLIAFETGQIKVNAYQASGAGYYVVIHGALTGSDGVYMHLQARSPLPEGSSVAAGQVLGNVGATGDAQGCHLHFERWTAPGWFVGGAAYDPLPELQYWDSYS